jgi:hypothetical protein
MRGRGGGWAALKTAAGGRAQGMPDGSNRRERKYVAQREPLLLAAHAAAPPLHLRNRPSVAA